VCTTGGGKPYKSSTPTRHPTHNARKAPDQRNPHPHKPRGQEGAKNHTNPAVKKQPRAVEFSRNNRQPSTNPHGLFPGCGTNPNQDLTENPGSAPVRSLLYRLSSRPPNRWSGLVSCEAALLTSSAPSRRSACALPS